ncbi:MAG: MotA/TolQ/ExbB proton channel family protein [Verrucomicrobia bacterium]|jgi:biopolymer transport protein ExbB|nr:MotA/TolQ/ExbB proton channel family protein [Verrucomicrobiota bacterium]
MNEILNEMWHTWTQGGVVMIAMVLLALVSYATGAHLLIVLSYRGLTKASDATVRGWVARPEAAPKRLRELIRYTQDGIGSLRDIEGRFREVEATQVTELDRRVAFLNVLVISAPLFGLLGTVLGMLLTFRAIGMGGSSTSEIIAKGISEALVATQTGMMVAIPGLVLATVAKRRRLEYVSFLARLEGITLRHFRPEFRGMTRVFRRQDFKPKPARPLEAADLEPASS